MKHVAVTGDTMSLLMQLNKEESVVTAAFGAMSSWLSRWQH